MSGSFDPDAVRTIAARIPRGRWFVRAGLPLEAHEQAIVDAYLRETGCTQLVRAASWDEARAAADDVRGVAAYDDDAAEAGCLRDRARAAADEAELLAVMTTIVDAGLDVFFRHAEAAVHAAGVRDPVLVRVAAGAAAESAYRGALAAGLREGKAHRFILGFALFAAGRWPLARIGRTLFLL